MNISEKYSIHLCVQSFKNSSEILCYTYFFLCICLTFFMERRAFLGAFPKKSALTGHYCKQKLQVHSHLYDFSAYHSNINFFHPKLILHYLSVFSVSLLLYFKMIFQLAFLASKQICCIFFKSLCLLTLLSFLLFFVWTLTFLLFFVILWILCIQVLFKMNILNSEGSRGIISHSSCLHHLCIIFYIKFISIVKKL